MALTTSQKQAAHRKRIDSDLRDATKALLRLRNCDTEAVYFNSPRGFANEYSLLPIPQHLIEDVREDAAQNDWADKGPQIISTETLPLRLLRMLLKNLSSLEAKEYVKSAEMDLMQWHA